MNVKELHKNRGWDRTDMSIEKLGQLAWSIRESGWSKLHPIHVETLPSGEKQIISGHRRTLALVLANQFTSATSVEELTLEIQGLVTTQEEVSVCPHCGGEVIEQQCVHCEADVNEEEIGTEVLEMIDPGWLVRNYNDIIHGNGDLEVPAEELEYTDELTSQLTLVQDGLGREDADVIGLAKALYRVVYELGGQQAQIEKFGLSRNEVAGYLAVAQLPDDVANLVAEGDFSITGCRLVYELDSSC
jgi:hypothetical protein